MIKERNTLDQNCDVPCSCDVSGPQVIKIFDLEVLKKGYYEGYDPSVNPTVANSFSTAAYRFGHSLVQRSFVRFDSNHRPVFNSEWN